MRKGRREGYSCLHNDEDWRHEKRLHQVVQEGGRPALEYTVSDKLRHPAGHLQASHKHVSYWHMKKKV